MHTKTHSAEMTPADVLSEHHRALEEQLDGLIADAQQRDAPDLRARWSRFDKELLRHLDYEEAAILPAFARQHAAEARAVLDEHARIRAGLLELGVSLDLHALRWEAVKDFVSQLRAHAHREDALLYPWSRRNGGAAAEQPAKHGFLQLGRWMM
jgi:hemerythrin-like domain-containing protein